MPPITAVVLIDPEELGVDEGAADVVLDGASVTPVAKEVLCTITTGGEV